MAPVAHLQGPRHDMPSAQRGPMVVRVVHSRDDEAVRLIFGILSFLVCLAAGVWAMLQGHGMWISALGLYFIGKALFVGPQLALGNR